MTLRKMSCLFFLLSMTGFIVCQDCKILDYLDGASNYGVKSFMPYSLSSEFHELSSLGEYYGDSIPWSDMRNFSFVERFHSENVSYYANSLADEIAEDIREKKERTWKYERPYSPYSPEEILGSGHQATWISYIMEFSVGILVPMDQINAFFNGGNITNLSNVPYHIRYSSTEHLDVLLGLSNFKKEMDESFKFLQIYFMFLQRGLNDLDQKIKIKNAVLAEAECVYDMISESNSTLHETFSQVVSKEQFLDYVNRFYIAITNAIIDADKTTQFLQREYDFVWNSLFLDLDINKLTTNFYGSFLEFRKIALNVDMDALARNITSLVNMFLGAVRKMELGKFPEMERFVDNLLRKTLGSEDFWLKIDELYQKSLNEWEETYSNRQKDLASTLQYEIIPFFEEILYGLENIPENESVLKKTVGFSEYVRYLPFFFDQKQTISRMNGNVCWVLNELYLMDFQTMKRIYGDNNIFKMLNNICFSNWPAGEEYPKSFDDFFEKMHALTLTVINNIVGPCQSMIG